MVLRCHGTCASHDPRGYENTRSHSGSEQRIGKLKRLSVWYDKNVKSKTAPTEIYSHRKSFVSLSSEELRSCKTPPKIPMASGSPGGHIVKDEGGYNAVFAEQGASAAQMAAEKFLCTISFISGSVGVASDAVSAYTQVNMSDAP